MLYRSRLTGRHISSLLESQTNGAPLAMDIIEELHTLDGFIAGDVHIGCIRSDLQFTSIGQAIVVGGFGM